MKVLVPVFYVLVLSQGYHLNSTREETISTQLWHTFGREIGVSQLNAESFLQSITKNFKCFNCTKCADVERMKLFEKMKTIILKRDNLIETSNEILFKVLLYGKECNISETKKKWLSCESAICIEGFLATELFGYDQPLYHDEDPVDKGLKRLMQIGYTPRNYDQCFTRNDLFKDFTENESNKLIRGDVKFLVAALTLRLSKGDCISLKTGLDFLTDLFAKYGTTDMSIIKVQGLENLMTAVGIERDHQHDHDHDNDSEGDHNHENEGDHDHDQDSNNHNDYDHEHYHHDHSQDVNLDTSESEYETHNKFTYQTSGHIELMHFDQGESLINSSSYNSRAKREIHDHLIKNDTSECWTAEDLFHKFDTDSSNGLNRDEFLHLCPALIQQKIRGKCSEENSKDKGNMAEVYGYGTLTVLIISLCSLLGIILMPIKHSHLYQYIMMCFIALAFGTLTGDALMHLIPEAIGLHNHEDHSHQHHDHENGEINLPAYFWKFFAMLAAIYALFIVETLSHMAIEDIDHKDEGNSRHNHSHIPSVDLVRMATKKDDDKAISTETLSTRVGSASTLNMDAERNSHAPVAQPQTSLPKDKCWGFTTLALVIIVGDGIHNIADGLTIGAAFSSNIKGGISSALAIFFHELPHEFGDFVILLSTGLSYKKALLWNFISSLTAFIGLFIGIELGENTEARQWILAIAAGMFLYIALGNMLPELKAQKAKNGAMGFLAQNVGVLVGMSFMIIIGIFEEKIQI